MINTIDVIVLNKFSTEAELFKVLKSKEHISNDIKEIIKTVEDLELRFKLYNEPMPFFTAIFKNSQLKRYGFNIQKFEGGTGIRITDKLQDIIDMKIQYDDTSKPIDLVKLTISALKEYFGKNLEGSELTRSAFKKGQDFEFDLLRLKDTLKSHDLTKNNGFQANHCEAGADVNINEFARSLDSKALPFHRVKISNKIINEAIESLNSTFRDVLARSYFKERAKRLKKSDRFKEYKLRNEALKALINNIIFIQKV